MAGPDRGWLSRSVSQAERFPDTSDLDRNIYLLHLGQVRSIYGWQNLR